MSDNVNEKSVIESTLERIEKLKELREKLAKSENELTVHEKDLNAALTVKGEGSDEYLVKKELLENTKSEVESLHKQIEELSYKKSELKPILDDIAKKFEDELRAEQEREFSVEIGPNVYTQDENGEDVLNPVNQKAGRLAFKRLLEYLRKDVKWTAKTAPGLLVLVRNMEENNEWVRDKEFDNIIKLRSSNVLVLWRGILEDMEGHGYYEAKTFLECWANCGKGISESVREIQKYHEGVRLLGVNLNTIEDEFLKSEDDLGGVGELTTQQEVAPEV